MRAAITLLLALLVPPASGLPDPENGSPALPGGRNRLDGEKSPYLLQHRDNPIWWYP